MALSDLVGNLAKKAMEKNVKASLNEAVIGFKGNRAPSLVKQDADGILIEHKNALDKRVAASLQNKARNAADKFKRSGDDYAKKIAANTLTLMKNAQKKDETPLSFTFDDNQTAKLADAFKNLPKTDAAITTYKDETANRKLPEDKKAFIALHEDLKPIIQHQHNLELALLDSLFDDPEFTASMDDPKTVQKHMTDALKKEHSLRLKELDQDITPNQLQSNERLEQAKAATLLIALMMKNTNNKHILDQQQRELSDPSSPLKVSSGPFNYEDFDLSKVQQYYSASGKDISISETGVSISSSSLEFGVTPPDILEIALIAKAKGWKSIKMNIEHSDPEKAKELAQEAARAALKAGFPPSSIKITFQEDGKTVTKTPAELSIDPSKYPSLVAPGETESKALTKEYKENIPKQSTAAAAATTTAGATSPTRSSPSASSK